MRVLLVPVLVLIAMAARDADACGNAMRLKGERAVKFVVERERALAEGRYDDAMKTDGYFPENRKLRERLFGVVEAAEMRKGKQWKRFVDNFRETLRERPDDVLLQARYAEARSHLSKVEKERALKTLTDLATRDLIAEPEAWEALARLRREAGDGAGAAEATKRCKAMTKRDVCGE